MLRLELALGCFLVPMDARHHFLPSFHTPFAQARCVMLHILVRLVFRLSQMRRVQQHHLRPLRGTDMGTQFPPVTEGRLLRKRPGRIWQDAITLGSSLGLNLMLPQSVIP